MAEKDQSDIQCHINWPSDISIITIEACATFIGIYLSTINTCLSLRSRPKEWLISSILSFALFAYDLHVCKLWNTAIWQEPAFDKASDLRVINLWSWYETLQNQAQGNINSLMVKYVQVWNRIFRKKYLVDGLALGHGMHNPEYQ